MRVIITPEVMSMHMKGPVGELNAFFEEDLEQKLQNYKKDKDNESSYLTVNNRSLFIKAMSKEEVYGVTVMELLLSDEVQP